MAEDEDSSGDPQQTDDRAQSNPANAGQQAKGGGGQDLTWLDDPEREKIGKRLVAEYKAFLVTAGDHAKDESAKEAVQLAGVEFKENFLDHVVKRFVKLEGKPLSQRWCIALFMYLVVLMIILLGGIMYLWQEGGAATPVKFAQEKEIDAGREFDVEFTKDESFYLSSLEDIEIKFNVDTSLSHRRAFKSGGQDERGRLRFGPGGNFDLVLKLSAPPGRRLDEAILAEKIVDQIRDDIREALEAGEVVSAAGGDSVDPEAIAERVADRLRDNVNRTVQMEVSAALGEGPDEDVDSPVVRFTLEESPALRNWRLLLLIALAGALGSGIHILRAFFYHSARYTLTTNFVSMYFTRPLVGACLGVVFYLVVQAGLLVGDDGSGVTIAGVYGYTATAAIVGMFSEYAVSKLEQLAEVILRKPKTVEHSGQTDHKPF